VYHENLNSWEQRALAPELVDGDVVGWLRNLDRKPWSLCVPRKDGEKWVGVYPDFIVFRRTDGGIIADVIDPHLLSDEFAPARARALAEYAANHADDFGRFELIIYADSDDPVGHRLDLCDEDTRKKVAQVTTHAHLRHLFEAS